MKNKAKVLKSTLAASFAFSLVTANPLQILAAPKDEVSNVTVDVYPKPQNISYISEEGMSLEGEVNVVIHGEQEDATLAKLEALLKENGIAYTVSDEVDETKANILISSSKDHCDECGEELNGDINALSEEQGYILNASNDINEKGEIKIIATDSDGAYYGLMTLTQMMQQEKDGKIAEAVISDYPSVKLRGFVEGFYGYPWTFEDRLSLMSESSDFKMNTYIYAPKDDPYHKDQWRELYPEDKAEELRQLAAEGKKDNVSFCWSAHPGNGFNYSNDTDYNYLIAKFNQLYDLGVRQFGISYDDLGGYVNGQQHADLINRVNREWVQTKGDVKPLIVVATRYCNGWGPSMTGYFKPFWETLDDDVVVMWTGANTMSAITKEAYDWPKRQTGVNDKDLAAWWNYPVNDYCDGNLMMSPLENLENDVDNLSGFFLNPMSQADASKVAIFSGADYSWNISAFERTGSWQRAINELVPEASAQFQRFADNISFIKDGFEFDESRYIAPTIDNFKTALQTDEGIIEAANTLKAEFITMKEDCATLRNINNKGLYDEIEQHLNAYEAIAEAGIASMDAFIDAENGNIDSCLTNINTTEIKLNEAQTYTVKSFEGNGDKTNVVKVCEKRIKPLLKDSISQIKSALMDNLFPQKDPAVVGNMTGLTGKIVELVGGNYVVADIAGTMKADQNVAIALPKAMKVAQASVTSENIADLKVQYSLNGIEWIDAEGTVAGNKLTAVIDATVSYVRIVNNSGETINVTIDEVAVAPVYNIGTKKVSTDLGTYGSYVISNAIDGRITSKFWSNAPAAAGSFFRLDLGKEIPLYDAKIYYAGNPKGPEYGIDGFAATKMEISTDGITWTQVGSEIKDENYVSKTIDGQLVSVAEYNAEGQMARYIRYVSTESNPENWIQVFEMPFNETVNNLGDDSIDIVDTTITTGEIKNLYDKDLTTAFTPTALNDGDTLTYAMTTVTNVGTLMIMQDPAAISNATVSVQDLDGNWNEIGILDQGTKTFDVDKEITNVKLTFHAGNPTPSIYEILVKEPEIVVEANKAALQIAVDVADTITEEELANVVPVVVAEFKAALAEAKVILANERATQVDVDLAFTRLASAMHMLEFVKGDKETLTDLVNQIENLNKDDYTTSTWAKVEDALKEANDVLANDNAMQEEVDDAYGKLMDAFTNLQVRADMEALQQLVNKVNDLEESKYIESTWAKLVPVLENAKDVLANKDATQGEVDETYEALLRAYLDLRLKPSKDLLNDLINKAQTLNAKAYTAESYAVLNNALEEAKVVFADPNASEKAVKAAVANLEAGMAGLEAKDALKSGDTKPAGGIKTGDTTTMGFSVAGLAFGALAFLKRRKNKKIG